MHRLPHISITRHIRVKRDVRVYNADDQEYWQKRVSKTVPLYGNHLKLYTRQKGNCEYCNRPFEMNELSHLQIHHLNPIALGGTNKLSNLRLIHQKCHKAIHNLMTPEQMSKYANNGINYLGLLKGETE